MSYDVRTNAVKFSINSLFFVVTIFGLAMAACGTAGIVWAFLWLLDWIVILNSWDEFIGAIRGRHAVIIGVVALIVLSSFLLPDVGSRPVSRAGMCTNHLKCLVLAMEAYKRDHDAYPPALTTDAQGKPKASWRVILLPYLEWNNLYDLYDFDEPWDSPENSKLSKFAPEGLSNYELVVTSSHDPTPKLIVEAPTPVPWMKSTALASEGFLQSVSGKTSSVPWTFGHHREELFTEHGWAFCAAILGDEEGRVIWSRDYVDPQIVRSLGNSEQRPFRIMPQQPWRIN